MYVNDVLHKKMHVEPLKQGDEAVFRLMQFGQVDKRNQPKGKAGLTLKGKSTIYDPFAEKRVQIINVLSYKIVELDSGANKQVPINGPVRFNKSMEIRCKQEDNEKYGYLMRHPQCKNNPWRDKNLPVLFYLVDKEAEAKSTLVNEEIELKARQWVREATLDDLMPVIKEFNINESNTPDEIKAECVKHAKKTPERVLRVASDDSLRAFIDVLDAENIRIIEFDKNTRTWYHSLGTDKKDIDCRVEVGMDHHQELVKFLVSPEGKTDRRIISDNLKGIMKKTA